MPLTPSDREAILQVLWPAGKAGASGVWAILDCARDPRVYLALLSSRLEFRCLYSGTLPRELAMVAPYLVELHPQSRLTERLLSEGWGRSWGIFLRIGDPASLRHHLRKFLKVQDEDGRRLLFRYFDPRVLRAYLPTCSVEELLLFFGPIDCFFTESAAGIGIETFSLKAGKLLHVAARSGCPAAQPGAPG
jgi:hypothetical protein